MKLPLFDEVREARRLATESDDAARLHSQAGTALSALSVAGQQVAHGLPLRGDIPGDDIIAEAMARFEHLAALSDLAPAADQPVPERLSRRRQQLLSLQELLGPIASQQQARAARVHQLQHEQFHHLTEPAYAELFQGIEQRNQERAELQLGIVDQRNRLTGLAPACEGLEQLLPAIHEDLRQASDPRSLTRARARLAAAGRIVAPALAAGGLPIPLPPILVAPPPALDHRDASHAIDALQRFAEALHAERAHAQAEIERLTAAHRAATRWILERTG